MKKRKFSFERILIKKSPKLRYEVGINKSFNIARWKSEKLNIQDISLVGLKKNQKCIIE